MSKVPKKVPLAIIAEAALQEAVYHAIKDHERTDDPVVIYKDGKTVKIHPSKLNIKKPKGL